MKDALITLSLIIIIIFLAIIILPLMLLEKPINWLFPGQENSSDPYLEIEE